MSNIYNSGLDASIVTDPAKGVVSALVAIAHQPHMIGIGTARTAPIDRFNETIGSTLALARALKDLGHRLEKDAWVEVKRQDKASATQREANERYRSKVRGRKLMGEHRIIIEELL